ncbi:hypothetical protein [Paraburkholderia sp. BCC1884]|uniref:hypothetical protein n=1 Tax=Paraburkholderia sp. BCC1884 TaxID=2562668 RepID=UPI0011842B62|nr:hypothetical protein [Paraburkholderia sp. BCC1884]
MNFYTLREAAAAIAAELHPDDDDNRAGSAARYANIIYGKLCDGQLIGRDPSDRDPIDPNRLGAVIAFHGCIINESDLNGWLARLGNGVQISGSATQREDCAPEIVDREDLGVANAPSHRPTSAQLAAALGPFLQDGRESDWLKRVLTEVGRTHKRLQKFRTLIDSGRTAIWDVGGVVLHLYGEKYLTERSARAFLEQNYPNDLYVTEHMDVSTGASAAATWFPTAT